MKKGHPSAGRPFRLLYTRIGNGHADPERLSVSAVEFRQHGAELSQGALFDLADSLS